MRASFSQLRAAEPTIDLDNLTPEQLISLRHLARRRLLPYILYTTPGYHAGWVHKDICSRLERFEQAVLRGESPRLILSMPPRHGKSQIASLGFPGWFLGRNPELEYISCSYSSTLASAFSKKVRDILRSPEFNLVFPETALDPEAQSVENWYTTAGGSYLAAGVGSGITGRGAHVLGIDDPVKNREDANSETFLEALYDWYTSTAYTRLAPGGGVLVIQTRWCMGDLAGRLEQASIDMDGDQFEIVTYPAIAMQDEEYRTKGAPLHAERYDLKALQRIRKTIGPRDWAALYQQSPSTDEGSYFKPEYLRFYDTAPPLASMTIYAVWDLAIGKKDTNDYSVGVVFGVTADDKIYVLDMRRGRWQSREIVEQIIGQYLLWKPTNTLIEKTHVSMSIGPYLEKTCRDREIRGLSATEVAPGRADKIARARSIQGRFQDGMVYLPTEEKEPWVRTMINELLAFPNGMHDDIVDTMAYLGIHLTMLMGGRNTDQPVARRPQTWRENLTRFVARGRGKTYMSA